MHIAESDWKLLRQLKDTALDRLCASILRECQELISAGDKTNHECYLALYQLVHERDNEIAEAFNGLSRSTAVRRLASMRMLGLVSDDEFLGFSEDTQRSVNSVVTLFQRSQAL